MKEKSAHLRCRDQRLQARDLRSGDVAAHHRRPASGTITSRSRIESSYFRAPAIDWEADIEAFRDHWGDRSRDEEDLTAFLDRPHTDPSLWKVAWDDDGVVGQVRSYIDPDENLEYERLRCWTENISTAKEWRGKGVAYFICESMRELKERGMKEVALGVHTENLTGAFQLYGSLGYEAPSLTLV